MCHENENKFCVEIKNTETEMILKSKMEMKFSRRNKFVFKDELEIIEDKHHSGRLITLRIERNVTNVRTLIKSVDYHKNDW